MKKAPIQLNIEKMYPIKPVGQIKNILVVGCGGTGSYVVPNLVRLLSTLKVATCLTLADADVVEDKNLIRQNFVKADVGKNKAEALARRYSTAFGISIQAIPKFLETAASIGETLTNAQSNGITFGREIPLVISCVDNIKARKFIIDALQTYYPNGAYLIDCGNEDISGQVLLSVIRPPQDVGFSKGNFPTPTVFDLYPELNERYKTEKLASELSCAEMAVSSPQYGFVNLNAATIALNFIDALLGNKPITTYMVEFTINNKFSQRSLSKSQLEGWANLNATKFRKDQNLFD